MNCAEFQEVLPEVIEGGRNAEQESHLRACPMCSGLVADLDMIASEARHLQEIAEPSPRVWNSIEIALRQEGIIRDPQLRPALTQPRLRSWSLAWLAPLAAVLLVGFSIAVYQRGSGGSTFSENVGTTPPGTVAKLQTGKEPSSANKIEDDQLLAAVAPAMQAQYASNLQNVNAYIQDAEESAKADPNDEEAQQIVMDAYEQRAAVYEMALDRSLP